MTIDLKNVKTCIMGIQGSGKSVLGKSFTREFKHPFYLIVNLDDINDLEGRVNKVVLQTKKFEEMEEIIKQLLILAQQGKCDAIFIDESDMLIPKSIEKLQNYPNMYDLFINHRHYKIAVFTMTRRPQDLNPLVVESSEHKFIFALETSDNIIRKMKAIDYRIPEMMTTVTKKSHKFIHKQLGEDPVLCDAIKLEKKNNGSTKS